MDSVGRNFSCCHFVLPDGRRCVEMFTSIYNFAYLRNYFAGGTASTHPVLQNRLTKFISGISMEIYLSHMVMFRVVENTGLNQLSGNGVLQYIVTVMLVLAASIVFPVVVKKVINISESKFSMLPTASARKG